MVSLLDKSIAKTVAQGFKGQLLTGTLRREVTKTVDDAGDPATSTVTTYPFEGIRDTFNAVYAAAAGIPVTDVRILIIAGSIKTVPVMDDKIFIRSSWYQVRRITEIDPANATYTLAAFACKAP